MRISRTTLWIAAAVVLVVVAAIVVLFAVYSGDGSGGGFDY